MPVTLKDKEDKTVTVIGNFVRIDNGEIELMLFFGMSNIWKVQGILEPNKNQFCIKLHEKAYIRKCGIYEKTGHSKGSYPIRPITQFNSTWSYFISLKLIVPQCMPSDSDDDDNNSSGYDKENKNGMMRW